MSCAARLRAAKTRPIALQAMLEVNTIGCTTVRQVCADEPRGDGDVNDACNFLLDRKMDEEVVARYVALILHFLFVEFSAYVILNGWWVIDI